MPLRRMEVPPGQEMQVDFGTGAPVVGADGRRRKTHDCFPDLAAQNQHLREWEKDVADTSIHGTTRQHVGRVFGQASGGPEKRQKRPVDA